VPLALHAPLVQTLPAQHGWPLPPHATQLVWLPVPVWHVNPGEQVAVSPEVGWGQQGWLAPPHAAQAAGVVAVWQKVFGAVQRLL